MPLNGRMRKYTGVQQVEAAVLPTVGRAGILQYAVVDVCSLPVVLENDCQQRSTLNRRANWNRLLCLYVTVLSRYLTL